MDGNRSLRKPWATLAAGREGSRQRNHRKLGKSCVHVRRRAEAGACGRSPKQGKGSGQSQFQIRAAAVSEDGNWKYKHAGERLALCHATGPQDACSVGTQRPSVSDRNRGRPHFPRKACDLASQSAALAKLCSFRLRLLFSTTPGGEDTQKRVFETHETYEKLNTPLRPWLLLTQ